MCFASLYNISYCIASSNYTINLTLGKMIPEIGRRRARIPVIFDLPHSTQRESAFILFHLKLQRTRPFCLCMRCFGISARLSRSRINNSIIQLLLTKSRSLRAAVNRSIMFVLCNYAPYHKHTWRGRLLAWITSVPTRLIQSVYIQIHAPEGSFEYRALVHQWTGCSLLYD